ncbi:MAG: hypothetical protein P1P64_00795 [Treponemataceae bacterium]
MEKLNFMKKILCLFFILSFLSMNFLCCTNLKGCYLADVYGDKMEIVFVDSKTATLIVNGESFPAQLIRKDGVIEIWQQRKTPTIYVKKLNSKELVLLNSKKNETEIIFNLVEE